MHRGVFYSRAQKASGQAAPPQAKPSSYARARFPAVLHTPPSRRDFL